MDSDDGELRLQIRMEGSGEGSDDPGRAAARVIDETAMHVVMSAHDGRMMISVWHSTLGFTTPGGQPASVSVRLQLPRRGYRLEVRAQSGPGSVHIASIPAAALARPGAR